MAYKITSIVEEPRLGDFGPTRDHLVQFNVGTDGPFFERFTDAEFSPPIVQLRLSARADTIAQIRASSL